MNHYIGFLIRQHRLERNLSQESLCKGICAVSYLSKIEKGQVVPSDEIIHRLLGALGVVFIGDPCFVKAGGELLDSFFNAFFFGEDTAELEKDILGQGSRMENSKLNLPYHLFLAYRTVRQDHADVPNSTAICSSRPMPAAAGTRKRWPYPWKSPHFLQSRWISPREGIFSVLIFTKIGY